MDKLFLCGHRKSGTTLLLNLLDGHPEIQTYPEDLCLMYGYFPHHIKMFSERDELKDRLDAVVFKMLERKASKRGYLEKLPVDDFMREFYRVTPSEDLSDINIVLPSLLSSYANVSNQHGKKFLAVKETSLEIYVDEMLQMFPSAKFVQLVRDPRDNYAAIKSGVKSYYSKLGESELESLASVLQRARIGLKCANMNRERLGDDRYHIIRFEDLVTDLQTEMSKLCRFLGLREDDALLAPTTFGVPQSGNNHEGRAFYQVSNANVGQWKNRISDEEAQLIEFFMSNEMQLFDYKRSYADSDCSQALSDYYKWSNYRYFYRDSFGSL